MCLAVIFLCSSLFFMCQVSFLSMWVILHHEILLLLGRGLLLLPQKQACFTFPAYSHTTTSTHFITGGGEGEQGGKRIWLTAAGPDATINFCCCCWEGVATSQTEISLFYLPIMFAYLYPFFTGVGGGQGGKRVWLTAAVPISFSLAFGSDSTMKLCYC